MTKETVEEASDRMAAACSKDVGEAMTALLMQHDTRLLFATLAAELAFMGASLRAGKVYNEETVARIIGEALVTALTLKTKSPKMIYRDDGDDIGEGTKQ